MFDLIRCEALCQVNKVLHEGFQVSNYTSQRSEINICFYTYLNPIPLFSPFFFLGFALGANIPSFSLSGILLRLYSGHRELRVLKTGYLNPLPVILGQSCPLSADLYGVFVHVNKIPFLFFFPFLFSLIFFGLSFPLLLL